MFHTLKHSIFKKRFQKSLIKLNHNRTTSNRKIVSVGVLTFNEISSTLNLQKEIESILNVRNVKVFSFKKFNKLEETSFHHFTEKDLNWKGEINNQNLLSFLEQPFDLLIGYFNKNNMFLENAILKSEATFKVGFSNVNSNLYEIEISEEIENLQAFVLELKKYLQILHKLKN